MSEQRGPARPPQVTAAAGVAIAGSVLLVVALFDAMGQIRSIEMRDGIEDFLSKPPGSNLGLSVSDAVSLLRGLVLFNGAVAAAAAVLGVYILLRHNSARILFTVAAAVLLVTAPFSGGLLPFVIAFSAVMLWSRPARDWFAGREPSKPTPKAFGSPPERRPDQHPDQSPDRHPDRQSAPTWPSAPPAASSGQQPAPSPYPFGQQGTAVHPGRSAAPDPSWAPPTQAQPPLSGWAPPPVSPLSSEDRERRPTSVTFAAILTWVFCGVTAVVYLLVIAMMVGAQDQLLAALRRDPSFRNLNVDTNDLLAALWVLSATSIFWCLAAMVLAYLTWRRVNAARIALCVSAAIAGLVSVLVFPVGLAHTVAAFATVSLLWQPGTRRWFSGGPGSQRPYDAPPPPRQEEKPPTNVW